MYLNEQKESTFKYSKHSVKQTKGQYFQYSKQSKDSTFNILNIHQNKKG